MNLSRFELGSLKKWAGEERRKPIVIRGARQVGKSTLVALLAEQAGLDLVTLNFERRPELAGLFTGFDPKQIIKLLQIQTKQTIAAGKSLLFLDEIQAGAAVILPALRYFYEEMPELHVIAAGSLLDFALSEAHFSMPVGRVDYLFLGPLSFEEFLLAFKEDYLLEFLKNYHLGEEYPAVIHEQLMNLLRQYFMVGGMPEAVAAYVAHQDFNDAERIKHSILNTYQDDFSKYGTPGSQNRIRRVFNRLPSLIGKKIKYSLISSDEKSTVIAAALEKLCLARVAYLVKHTAGNGVPLGAQVNEKIFKPLFLDVGLMCTSLGLNFLDIAQQTDMTLINSGAVAEQFIGQHLLYLNPSYQQPQLYYWVREQKSSSAEIDYVISIGHTVLPIEVKAGKSGALKSLHYFLQEKSLNLGVKFNAHFPQLTQEQNKLANGLQIQYQLLSLPLYFVGQLNRLFAEYTT